MIREYLDSFAGDYRLLDDVLQEVEVGVAFDKTNPSDAAEELRKALEEMKDDGTLKEILEEYGVIIDTANGGES
jgi:ABC-type amino acid transport substrate-binding protein